MIILTTLSKNNDSIEITIKSDLFPGFISAVARIKNSNKKNADPATHAGTISIIIPLKRIRLSATVTGEKIARIPLTVLRVRGVNTL